MRTRLHYLSLAFLAAAAALDAAPTLTEISPRGAQQGKTFTLTLSGRELLEGSQLSTSLPAVFTAMTGTMKGLPYLVELKADAAPGIYPIRVRNQNGISNILFFTVGNFPEIDEGESADHPNNSIATATPVKSTPVVINGTLVGADRDFYRVAAKAGERKVFEVEARRCGSAIDPVLELYDAQGELLARNEDAPGIGVDSRVDYTFPREGNYFVMVRDARLSKQEQNFYRLRIGAFAYPEWVYPLGGRPGQTVDFEFGAKGAATPVVKSRVTLPSTGRSATVSMPGSPVLPFRISLSAADDMVDGRIEKPGVIVKQKVAVTPGESVLVRVQSRETGVSRLDALVTAYGPKGEKLGVAGDTAPPLDATMAQLVGRTLGDPSLNFKVPEGVHEITVAVEDLAGRGGPEFGYRMSIRKVAEDFSIAASPAFLNVPRGGTVQVAVSADRRGYDGAIRAHLENLPKGWTAEGGFIAPETVDETGARLTSRNGVITLTAAADAEPAEKELVVAADVVLSDGSKAHREASGSGAVIDVAAGTGIPDAASTDRQKSITAPWLEMAMPAALAPEPVATISVKQIGRTRMSEGDAFDFEWTISAKDKSLPMPATISVNAAGARDLRVIDMKPTSKGAATGTFRVTTTKSTAPATYDLVVNANLVNGTQRENIAGRAIPWVVTTPEESK